MARSPKCRRVCCEPKTCLFLPQDGGQETVNLSVEQLEALRLCDLEAWDQDEAARKMGISRGTFQRILYSAHSCVAEALVNGRAIRIGGGNYRLDKPDTPCRGGCRVCRVCVRSSGHEKGD